jgi:hypothetical protein
VPTNDSERLLYRQMFETLVRVDCNGAVQPGLAATWVSDESGKVWTFTLRQGARFPSGLPMSSTQLVHGWLARQSDLKALGIDSAESLDDRRFRVTLRAAHHSIPPLFADPTLIIIDGLASVGPVARVYSSPQGKPVVDLQLKPNSDLRDALDNGTDLVVTRDPAVADYIAARPGFATFPLPWSRTYVLLQPRGAEALDVSTGTDSLRRSLARDVVRADARPTESPFWSEDLASCANLQPSDRPQPDATRVVYRAGDDVARQLAERIVALAGDKRLRATPLGQTQLAAALKQGTERAYVIALPHQTLAPCRDAASLGDGPRILPLIDTRARAIVRRGSPPLVVEWDGTIRAATAMDEPSATKPP